MESNYEITRQLLSTGLKNLFLCGIWAFNTFVFLTNFANTLGSKIGEGKEKKIRNLLLVFTGVMTIVSFGILIYLFTKL